MSCLLKSQNTDEDTFMECNQRGFIFEHSPPCILLNFSVGVAVLGPVGKKPPTFQPMNFQPTLVSIYLSI